MNIKLEYVLFAILAVSVALCLSACSTPAVNKPVDNCLDWAPKTILGSDDKATRLEKLEYNTYMQGACDDGRF